MKRKNKGQTHMANSLNLAQDLISEAQQQMKELKKRVRRLEKLHLKEVKLVNKLTKENRELKSSLAEFEGVDTWFTEESDETLATVKGLLEDVIDFIDSEGMDASNDGYVDIDQL